MHPIVIVGAGLAGYTTARELRKLDKDTPLMLISADDGRFYSKPMLSNAYAQGKTAEQLALQDVAQMQTQLNATILVHTRVSGIDTAQHTLTCDGKTLPYSKLVLALGADPIRAG
ncbi:MAG: FAD-dependent oxidoreductase [Gammaproteobacteria bacterium]|nr:FAD-dependent oxidoreductase [Gammaproteobacteria bacterium]